MQLLYCINDPANGWIVRGFHDSTQNVDASAYGDSVRVIPYDQPISTLNRVGPIPTPPRPDSRPISVPTETPAILVDYSAQVRWEVVTGGVSFNSVPANTDRVSQTLIANLAQYATTLSPTDNINFTQDGVAYQITAQDAISLNNQIIAQAQQARTIEAQCIADLNSATPTIQTYDDVDAKFAGLKAKTLKHKKK